jgi:thioredoxin-related protein
MNMVYRCTLLMLLFLSSVAYAQNSPAEPPYKRFPTLPAIQVLLGDSTTKYSRDDFPKKTPVLLMLFSPDCSHCQHTAEEMVKAKEQLKDIHIVMATLHSITQMNEFVEKYGLSQMSNVVVGKDIYFFMPHFYDVKSMPYMAFYNKKGELIQGLQGSLPVPKIIEVFKNR